MLQFQYRPLDRTKSEIRLVQLQPVNTDAADTDHINNTIDVHCQMWHVSLDENPTYLSLSYVWGDATRRKPIFVYERNASSTADVIGEPKHLRIPDNLYDALISLKDHSKPITLWIDAICINQDNDEEKSWQVQQMARIFNTATFVIAWLGQAADNSDLLFDLLHPILSRALIDCPQILDNLTQPTLEVEEWDSLLVKREPRVSDKDLQKFILDFADLEKSSMNVLWRAMGCLTNRLWWRRIWIIQEFALANSVKFICGTKSCNARDFLRFRHFIGFFADGFFSCRHISALAMRMWLEFPLSICSDRMLLYRNVKGKTDWSFADLLMSLCDAKLTEDTFEASDPRDRIFALLQVDPDIHKVPIAVDYSMSCSELYIAVAHYLIRFCDANVLRYSQAPKLVKDLPSWVPDWSSRMRPPNGWSSYTPILGATSACARIMQNWPDEQHNADNILPVRGVTIGQINNVVAPVPSATAIRETAQSNNTPLSLDAIDVWLREVHLSSQLSIKLRQNSQQVIHNRAEASLDLVLKTILPVSDRDLVDIWPKYQKLISIGIKSLHDSDLSSYLDTAHFFGHFWSSAGTHCDMRRLYITSNGYFGLGPEIIRPSDTVVIIYGVHTPLIIRQLEDLNFELIGETYIDELMDGQFMTEDPHTEVFNLC